MAERSTEDDMDEDEIYEGLGLERPEPEGGEPDAEPGGNAPENQDGTGDVPTEETAPGEPEESATQDGEEPQMQQEVPEQPPVPTADERETARRQAEIDQAYAAAFAGKLDPYTKQPITCKADYDRYQAKLRADQQRQQEERMRQAGVAPEAVRALIDQHPVVREAQEVIQAVQAERERAQAEQAKGWYGEQLKQINALDPEAKVTSLEDLAARDQGQYRKMMGMVGAGVPLADAYKALNFDALAQKRAAAAQQAVRNQAAGKAHLAPVGGQGKSGVDVPAEVRAMYRDLNPDMTDAQIKAEYGKYLAETGQ